MHKKQIIKSYIEIDGSWPKDGVTSLSSSNVIHKRPEQYLAELMLLIKEPNLIDVKKFWTLNKYKENYIGLIVQISQRLKYCDFKVLHNAIVKHSLIDFKERSETLIFEEIKKTI